jgi:hypothetical protein
MTYFATVTVLMKPMMASTRPTVTKRLSPVLIANSTAMATTFVPMVSSATTRSGTVGPRMTR